MDFLYTARPTAVNLGAATRRLTNILQASLDTSKDVETIAKDLIAEGNKIADEDVGRNKEMSKWGGEWLVERVKGNGGSGEGLNVLTVCNTGSLATSVRDLYPIIWTPLIMLNIGIWYSTRVNNLLTRDRKAGESLFHPDCTLSSRIPVNKHLYP